MTNEELMQEELNLESSYRQDGYEAALSTLYEAKEKEMVDTALPIGQAFFRHKAMVVKKTMEEWLIKNMKPKAGVKQNFIFLLDDLKREFVTADGDVDIDTIANICSSVTLSCLINALTTNGSKGMAFFNDIGARIGVNLMFEYQTQCFDNWLKTLPKEDKNRKALAGIDKRIGMHYRYVYMKKAVKNCGYTMPTWEQGDNEALINLGCALLTLTEDTTGYWYRDSDMHTPTYLVPTPEFIDAWKRNEDNMLALAHKSCPMVVPPKEWVSYDEGGYYGDLAAFSTFLRLKYGHNAFRKTYEARLHQLDTPDVYKAVNSIQATAWRINKEVLSIIKHCRTLGYIPYGKQKDTHIMSLDLDDGKPADLPEHPTDEMIKEYKKNKAQWWKGQKRRISIINRSNTMINIADKFSVYENIYFPWNMDFRGRIYPIPSFSPQGDDICKGLLLFSDTPPCQDPKDTEWLAITGANLAGEDKISYADRIQWVYANEEVILDVAKDPMGNLWWLHKDKKPVQLLAWCLEWAKAKQWITEHGSIVGWVTGLPYAQDGTCSGLQHFSAILRDPIGGTAVNLVPQDKPNDIYRLVADKVNVVLKQDAMSGTIDEWDEEKLKTKFGTKTMAQIWLNYGVNRTVTKRPTMTLAYGAKKRGYTEQIMEDTIRPALNAKTTCGFTETNAYQCAMYMAELIWNSVGATVVRAVEGMDWLHKVSKLVTKNANVVSWCTPLGLLLQQNYLKYESKVIKLRCAGKRFRVYVPHQTGVIDKTKQANGIAPNFIHSMDACHLQMTVCRAKDAGINHFTMVHDSYGCPMSQAKLMYEIVRKAFVDMYTEHDVLEEFRQYLQPLVNKELPAPPKKGDLDLNIVLDSKYIFC